MVAISGVDWERAGPALETSTLLAEANALLSAKLAKEVLNIVLFVAFRGVIFYDPAPALNAARHRRRVTRALVLSLTRKLIYNTGSFGPGGATCFFQVEKNKLAT